MTDEPSERAEHLVVGAGVIGLATAYELLRRGLEVLVLERDAPGGAATSAAGGMLAPVYEAELEEPELIRFGLDSLRRYPEFVRELEQRTGCCCAYREQGTLWVALDRDDRAEMLHLKETLRRKGLEAQALDGDEVRQLEPHLSHRVVGGLLVQGDHQVDPRALARCLERAIRDLGGRILTGMEVREVVARHGTVRAVMGLRSDGSTFEVEARRIVVAAGAWSAATIRLPVGPLGLRPVKGQLVRLRGPALLERVVRTAEVYLVPRADGELLVGATMEEMGFDLSATAGAVMDLLRHGWEALPGIYDLELKDISVGLRSSVDDQLPVIGGASIEGLFLAFGHFRNGILLAPATAHYLAGWIAGGPAPVELEPFLPGRLAGQGVSRAT